MKSLSQDTFDWELVGSLTSQLNSFFSDKNYLPNVSFYQNASLAKFECIFPFPFEHVLCCCLPCSEVDIFDVNVNRSIDCGSVSHEDLKNKITDFENFTTKYGKRSCSIITFDCRLPWPCTTPRKYPVVTSMDYDPSTQTFTMVHKPCEQKTFSDFEKTKKNFDWKSKHKSNVFTDKKIIIIKIHKFIIC